MLSNNIEFYKSEGGHICGVKVVKFPCFVSPLHNKTCTFTQSRHSLISASKIMEVYTIFNSPLWSVKTWKFTQILHSHISVFFLQTIKSCKFPQNKDTDHKT